MPLSQSLLGTFLPIIRLSAWLTILVVIFVPLERLFAAHPREIFRKGFVTDLGYYFLNSLLPAALIGAPLGVLAWFAHAALPDAFLAMMGTLPLGVRVALGLVVGEVGYYWGHRWSHEIPLLWRFHAIHHAAEEVDFLVNTHAHPVDMVFSRFCGLVPIYLLGLSGPIGQAGSTVAITTALIGTVWGYFIHANLRWRFGPLEWLVSTPAFHHWHHTRTGPLNRNYASTLPWLDRLFGNAPPPRHLARRLRDQSQDSRHPHRSTRPSLPAPPAKNRPSGRVERFARGHRRRPVDAGSGSGGKGSQPRSADSGRPGGEGPGPPNSRTGGCLNWGSRNCQE